MPVHRFARQWRLLGAAIGLSILLGWAAGCHSDPQTAVILDVFDLVERYYVEKVDPREITANALAGLVDHLKKDVQIEVQTEKIKEFLRARDRGEDVTPPVMEETEDASPTPIPTPFDDVKVTVAPTHLRIEGGGQIFDRDLPADKRALARVLLDGVAFCRSALRLKQSPEELQQMALDSMLYKLDPHSGFLELTDYKQLKQETEGSFGGVGIEISMVGGFLTIVSPLEGAPAQQQGLRSKDRITAIDHLETIGQTIDWAVKRIRGKIGTTVVLTIRRPGEDKTFDVTLARTRIEAIAIKSKLLPGRIGHVRVIQFNARTADDLEKALREFSAAPGGLRALILDLRNDPGGLLDQAVAVTDKFLTGGLIVNTIGRGSLEERERYASSRGAWTRVPLVVLVNNGSASASEIVAGALKDHQRGLVVGWQTFGKGSVQSIFELRNEAGLRLTTAMYYTPSGESIQAHGITPHIRFDSDDPDRDLYSEAKLEGHIDNSNKRPAQQPLLEVNAKNLYDHYLAKGLIKSDAEAFSDDADFLLVFVRKLLDEATDFSIGGLTAQAQAMLDKVPGAFEPAAPAAAKK
ncbi:MAG: S41 family peptidase [Myxococcales bacterium]|nr:S41 family peptidase [Myxococcales bacterium]